MVQKTGGNTSSRPANRVGGLRDFLFARWSAIWLMHKQSDSKIDAGIAQNIGEVRKFYE